MNTITNDNQALSNLPSTPIKSGDILGYSYVWLNRYSDDLEYLITNKVNRIEFNNLQQDYQQTKGSIEGIKQDNINIKKDIASVDTDIDNVKQQVKSDSDNISQITGSVASLKNTVIGISSEVSGFDSRITSNTDAIKSFNYDFSSKADTSWVSQQIKQEVNNRNTTISNAINNEDSIVRSFIASNYNDKNHTINSNMGTLNDNDDLNNYTAEGMYTILNPQNLKNAPVSNYQWSRLVVFNFGGAGCYQLYFAGSDVYIRLLSGVPTTWGVWSPYAGTSVVNTSSDQTISGQKVFSQYPQTVDGETMYPASSTGWITDTGLTIGKNITNSVYTYRIDTINHNATLYISASFKFNSNFGKGSWGSDDNVIFKIPSPYNFPQVFRYSSCYYSGTPTLAPLVFRTKDNYVFSEQIGSDFIYNNAIEISVIIPLNTVFS